MNFASDLWGFLKTRKKFWLLPLVVILALLGLIVVLGSVAASTSMILSFSGFSTISSTVAI